MVDRPSSRVPLGDANAVRRALAEPEATPLSALLPAELDEERVPRMWREVDFRLSARNSRNNPAIGSLRPLAVAAFLLIGIAALFWQRRVGGELRAEGQSHAPTELESHASPNVVRFQDGSRVELGSFARLEVLRNDGRSFVTVLRRGKSWFDVQPGGPRHWVIEAGVASVEVVGTRFSVERDAAGVHVGVERGVVLVRAESLAHGSVQLTAGERVDVPTPPHEDGPAFAPPSALTPSELPLEQAASRSSARPALAPPGSASASALGVTNAAVPADDVDRALARADAARQRGDRSSAVRDFEAAIAAAAASDPRRGMAALSLARLLLPTDPGKAATVLERSFSAVPVALREDAWARRVEAEGRAGNLLEAGRLAHEYERRFPDGKRAEQVRRWLER